MIIIALKHLELNMQIKMVQQLCMILKVLILEQVI